MFTGLVLFVAIQVRADSASIREYQVKAAFLYNFIQFIDWPKEKTADVNEPIMLGIIGEDPFGNDIEIISGTPINGRKVVVKRFKGFEELKESDGQDKTKPHPEIETIRKCYLLFICSSEEKNVRRIVEELKGSYVLTVGEAGGFLESGGIIKFVMEEKKIRFEINVSAAEKAGLTIRSQLLRLARKVIRDEGASATEGK